jgi:hypothetical protein
MSKVDKKNPYNVLEISRNATEDEIKAAYKRMVDIFTVFQGTCSHCWYFRPGAGTLIAMSQEKK